MTKKTSGPLPKLVLSSSRDIPFSQLVLSQKNVRRVKAGLSIEDLAEDIYRRTLLQSLNVRAVIDEDGKDTGMYEVPAGGRRFRALELLVKSKRMAKDQPVPCVVREAGIAEEDSLAENVMRVGLHPLDQFRAFSALIEAGLSEDDIAARFFVSVSTVRQRLRLASVAPSLLEIYGEDSMTLEQLMAFTVTENHARQEQVWEQLSQTYQPSAYQIRRLLTEDAIAAGDRRVRFIGLDAYTEAGGWLAARTNCRYLQNRALRSFQHPNRPACRSNMRWRTGPRRAMASSLTRSTSPMRCNRSASSARSRIRQSWSSPQPWPRLHRPSRAIHRPKATAVALGVFLRCEIFIFPLERPTLDHPSPTIHDHLEFDIAYSRASGCNRAGVARPIQIIVDGADLHLLSQEAHAQQPPVRVDRDASG
jgi:ParB/RepB/Spo0J family partition protein